MPIVRPAKKWYIIIIWYYNLIKIMLIIKWRLIQYVKERTGEPLDLIVLIVGFMSLGLVLYLRITL